MLLRCWHSVTTDSFVILPQDQPLTRAKLRAHGSAQQQTLACRHRTDDGLTGQYGGRNGPRTEELIRMMWRYRDASTSPDRSAPPNVPQSKHELLRVYCVESAFTVPMPCHKATGITRAEPDYRGCSGTALLRVTPFATFDDAAAQHGHAPRTEHSPRCGG